MSELAIIIEQITKHSAVWLSFWALIEESRTVNIKFWKK